MSKQLVDPDIVKETLQAEAAFSDDEEKDACQVRNFDDCLRSRDSGCSPSLFAHISLISALFTIAHLGHLLL
jgi:hypothetical protein